MSTKLLTLVVPTYNMERYLPTCLDSVTAKLISDKLEVIVVNDGSTDGSLQIIRTYEQKRPDIIKVIDKENGHYGSCINAGLAAATGKYFKILDADDWFGTEALAEYLHKLETCDTDLVVTLRIDEVFNGDTKIDELIHPFNTVLRNHHYKMDEFYLHTHAYDYEFGMYGLTYKTELLRNCNFRLIEGINYTDTLYCFLPHSHVKDFIVFDLYLYHYRIGREGQSVGVESHKKNLMQIVQILEKMFDTMDQEKRDKHTQRNLLHFIYETFNFFMYSLKMQSGIKRADYQRFAQMMRYIRKYHIHHPFFKKWYLKPWRATKSSLVLDLFLGLHAALSSKKH